MRKIIKALNRIADELQLIRQELQKERKTQSRIVPPGGIPDPTRAPDN